MNINNKKPSLWTDEKVEDHLNEKNTQEQRDKYQYTLDKLASSLPYFEDAEHSVYASPISNIHISKCVSCDGIAIWIHDRLVWPKCINIPLPNPDLPADVRRDFEEAGSILALSPRGAAALLRLAIQKLCKHLGGKGKKIDEDIAALVREGLDRRVEQALDVVRVIGNQAVHPGQIDLNDDRAIAGSLFGLVNLIAEKMISEPKHVQEMFDALPEGARKAVENRKRPALSLPPEE